MVKEITCYEDGSGKLHKEPYEAHRADLALWLGQCSAVNEASAKALTDYIIEHRKELQPILDALLAHAPKPEATVLPA